MGRLSRGALIGLILACGPVLGAGADAVSAPAPETMAISAASSSLSWPAEIATDYRVEMTSPAQPRSFEVEWAGPRWPGRSDQNGFLGSPLAYGKPRLEGPGTLTRLKVRQLGRRFPLFNPCRRGSLPDPKKWPVARYRISLPAETSSTFVVPVSLAATPRRKVRYGTRFNGYLVDPERFVGPANIISSWERLRVGGRTGVDVRFRLRRHQRLWQLGGRSPELIGVTSPPVRSRKLHVRAIDTGYSFRRRVHLSDWSKGTSKSLGTYRTDRLGRFRLRSRRLPQKRYYRIMVRIPAPGPGLARDWDCGPSFNTWPYDP